MKKLLIITIMTMLVMILANYSANNEIQDDIDILEDEYDECEEYNEDVCYNDTYKK